jgi:DtxR family Mn-dependent transcriptional regulator
LIDPLLALIIGTLILVVSAIFFWPEKGILSRIKKSKLDSKKVLLEDALKYIYDCEYNNLQCTIDAVADKLNISPDSAAKLFARLEVQRLAKSENDLIKLTKEGHHTL